jgi:hypothetical protein
LSERTILVGAHLTGFETLLQPGSDQVPSTVLRIYPKLGANHAAPFFLPPHLRKQCLGKKLQTGLLENNTGSLRGVLGDGHVDFEIVLNGANESNNTSIPVAAIALVSGMAVLLQSIWFLVNYSYQRRQADSPM